MGSKTRHGRRFHASALRRIFVIFLATAYVLVGVAGEISCAEETLAAAGATEVISGTATSDEGSKKAPMVVEHCYTCVPLLLPPLVAVAGPIARTVRLSFEAPTFVLEDHPGIETPPPKHPA
jgi:hypothetical protein